MMTPFELDRRDATESRVTLAPLDRVECRFDCSADGVAPFSHPLKLMMGLPRACFTGSG
jgi:hypothetical protein